MKTFREHRRARFISIEDLAKQAGVATKTIVDLEHGRTRPKFRTIRKLSEALKVDPSDVAEFAAVVRREEDEAADTPIDFVRRRRASPRAWRNGGTVQLR